METIFLICVALGGTVMVIQFVMTLAGLGGDGFDVDAHVGMPHDVPVGDAGHLDHAGGAHYDSSWFFGIVSFRTIVAAIAFFGIFGMIARTAGWSLPLQILTAITGGAVAMYVVGWLMNLLRRLGQEGTLRIENALGRIGTVYVPIPAEKSTAGKIQLNVQGRVVEYAAITAHREKLPTGAKVEVVGVIGQNTLEVRPVDETAQRASVSTESATT